MAAAHRAVTSQSTLQTLFQNAKQTSMYKDFRPVYPQRLYDDIYQFAGHGQGTYPVAVDIATGSGQALGPMVAKYQKIYALDCSKSQIEQADAYPNVEYKVADSHDTGLPNQCADLVTVGQALHWFEIPKFYHEVRRIIKPTGVFAAWCYDLGYVNEPTDAANEVLLQLYDGTLGPYWNARRNLVDKGYEGMEPPPTLFKTVTKHQLLMPSDTTLEQFLGYLQSWSSYTTYKQKHPDLPDPLDNFQVEFMAALGAKDMSHMFTITRRVTLLMAKDPVLHTA